MTSPKFLQFGNIHSVLQIGPTPIKDGRDWTLEKANTIDHFLDVMMYLSKSDWNESSVTVTSPTTATERPDLTTLNSVLAFVRQLHTDKLFYRAHAAYLEHCSNNGKEMWVNWEKDLFKKTLKHKFIMTPKKYNGEELIDNFLYGFGLIHSDKPKKIQNFRTLIDTVGNADVLLEFHLAFSGLIFHAGQCANVITQDLDEWRKIPNFILPNRVRFAEVLG